MSLCLGGHVLAQAPAWPSERPPRPLPAREIKFPPYEVRTLANGLQVVAVLHHEQPAVSMRLLIRAGTASDPVGKLGVAHLVGSLLDQGTTTMSAQQLADAVDFIGGSKATGAGTDLSFINMVVMKDSFEAGLRMVADMAERPAFAPEEIERQRQQTLSALRVNMADPAYIATMVFDRLVYGFNPYGMPDNGTVETTQGITRNDLVAFHNKFFVPNNAILAVVGDVTAEEAFSTVERVFGSWPMKAIAKDKMPDPPGPARRVVVIDKPDSVQTEVRVGHIGIPRNHPDYTALNLAVRILGGEGSNRLHQVLRTQRSLTYGAQADMDAMKDGGDIVAETNTRSEATGEVLRLIVEEFWRLQRERVSQGELAAAKAYMTGNFPLTVETPDSIAIQVLNAVFYGLPMSQLQTFRERVNAVTVDDIERVARFYLKPDAVSVVLVGNASVFGQQLRGVGFGRFESISLNDLDLLKPDFKRGAAGPGATGRSSGLIAPAPPASPPPASGRRPAAILARFQAPAPTAGPRATVAARPEDADGMVLFEKVLTAKGGRAALERIKGITAVTTATMEAPAGRLDTETTTYLEYPNHVRVETKTAQGDQLQVYDGQRGWVRDRFGVQAIPDAGLREMQISLKRDVIAALLATSRGELRVRPLPNVKESGSTFRTLEVSGPGFEPVVFAIDAETNLIAKQTFVVEVPTPNGTPARPLIEELFSDYRLVSGVKIPFTSEVRSDGRQILTRRITNVLIVDTPLDPQLFKRPSS